MKEQSYVHILTALEALKAINATLKSETIQETFDCLETVLTDETELFGNKDEMEDDEYWERNEAFDNIVKNPDLTIGEKARLLKEKEEVPDWFTE